MGFTDHGGTSVRVDHQLVFINLLTFDCGRDEFLSDGGRLIGNQSPAHDIATEDIQNDIQLEVDSFTGTFQCGDIPTPQLIGGCVASNSGFA